MTGSCSALGASVWFDALYEMCNQDHTSRLHGSQPLACSGSDNLTARLWQAVRTWLTQQEESAAERACAQAVLPPQTCRLIAPA